MTTTPSAEPRQDRLSDKIGRFVAIPHTFIKDLPNLPPCAHTLFLYLRSCAHNGTGDAFPAYDTIANETGMARATVSKAITALVGRGWITKKRRFSNSTIYELCDPSISSKFELMDTENRAPLVQNLNCISSEIELPLVQKLNSININISRKNYQHQAAKAKTELTDDDDDDFKNIKAELAKQGLVMTSRTIKAAKRLATSPYALDIIKGEVARVSPTSKSKTGVLLTALERFDIATYTPPVKTVIRLIDEY